MKMQPNIMIYFIYLSMAYYHENQYLCVDNFHKIAGAAYVDYKTFSKSDNFLTD